MLCPLCCGPDARLNSALSRVSSLKPHRRASGALQLLHKQVNALLGQRLISQAQLAQRSPGMRLYACSKGSAKYERACCCCVELLHTTADCLRGRASVLCYARMQHTLSKASKQASKQACFTPQQPACMDVRADSDLHRCGTQSAKRALVSCSTPLHDASVHA